MPKIISIDKIKRNRNKFAIELDNGTIFSLMDEVIFKNGLKLNKEIDETERDEMIFESQKIEGFDRALHTLEKTMKTQGDIQKMLKEKTFSERAIAEIVKKLKEYGYINDEEYAKQYVSAVSKSKGKRLIEYELKQKGLNDVIIHTVTNVLEDEIDIAIVLAKKFMKGKDISKDTISKLYRHLMSKGFDYEDVKSATKAIEIDMEVENENWN